MSSAFIGTTYRRTTRPEWTEFEAVPGPPRVFSTAAKATAWATSDKPRTVHTSAKLVVYERMDGTIRRSVLEVPLE